MGMSVCTSMCLLESIPPTSNFVNCGIDMERLLLSRTVPWVVPSVSQSIVRFHHSSPSSVASRHCIFSPSPVISHFSSRRVEIVENNGFMSGRNGKMAGRAQGVVCHAGHGALLSTYNLQLIAAISSVVLMLSRSTAVRKPFLVPLFALLAPASVISWIKGEYGMWTAFIGLLVRILFFIPGDLDLALMTLVLISVAPYQVINFRGTQGGSIIALIIVSYLAFQHFSWAGSIRRAFENGPLIPSLAIICVAVASILFMI